MTVSSPARRPGSRAFASPQASGRSWKPRPEQAHASLSEFVRRKALELAEAEVLNRSVVTIPAKDWEAFEA